MIMEESLLKNNAEKGLKPDSGGIQEKKNATKARFKEQNKTGILDDIKNKISAAGSRTKSKTARYDESLITKTTYFLHLMLIFSGRITKQLMESYKRVFDFPEEESGNIYLTLGMDFLAKEDYTQAIASFKKSLDLHPENKEVFYYLGSAYFKEKQYQEALNAYLSAVNAAPDNADAHFELGLSYAALENYKEAVTSYRKAIDLTPENDEIYYCLGVSFDQTKEYRTAIENFKKAIDINPRESRYYHSLGFTFECLKQHDKAIECFKKAIELERG